MFKSYDFLFDQIKCKSSLLCVGLDPELSKLPAQYKKQDQAYLNFCKDIVELTHRSAIAYKINVAFFESQGVSGWLQFEELVKLIPSECLIIADAKRADIGNTSKQYAEYYFNKLNVDGLTLHPYMGVDSLQPFLDFKNKYSIVLALTSNPGSEDFEFTKDLNGSLLYERVIEKFTQLAYSENIMFVCGATHPQEFIKIRKICPEHFLLVPGVGEQGGVLKDTIESGKNSKGGLLITISRKICYPSVELDFKTEVQKSAMRFQTDSYNYFLGV